MPSKTHNLPVSAQSLHAARSRRKHRRRAGPALFSDVAATIVDHRTILCSLASRGGCDRRRQFSNPLDDCQRQVPSPADIEPGHISMPPPPLRFRPDKSGEKAPEAPSCAKQELAQSEPFWKQKPLEAFSRAEWESLCDGCGRCCLVKLEDEDTGEIHFTDVGCKLLDAKTCQCTDYAHRRRKVSDCIKLTPDTVRRLSWLPPSCAYRLVAEGRDLAWWHPLVSGSATSVHEAGVSVRGRVQGSEKDVKLKDYIDHIVAWPGKKPRPSPHGKSGLPNQPKPA